MTKDEIDQLKPGDIVRHASGNGYIVIETLPHVIAIRTIKVTNPSEWELMSLNNQTLGD